MHSFIPAYKQLSTSSLELKAVQAIIGIEYPRLRIALVAVILKTILKNKKTYPSITGI